MKFLSWLETKDAVVWAVAWLTAVTLLLIAGLLSAAIGVVFFLLGNSRSNCTFYALRLWMNYGGYIVLSWSEFTKFPHFRHTFNLKDFTEFSPEQKTKRVFPPIIFKGRTKDWKPRG